MSIKGLKEELREMVKDCKITSCSCEECKHTRKCFEMSEDYESQLMLDIIEGFEEEQKERGNSYE